MCLFLLHNIDFSYIVIHCLVASDLSPAKLLTAFVEDCCKTTVEWQVYRSKNNSQLKSVLINARSISQIYF